MDLRVNLDESKFGGPDNLALLFIDVYEAEALALIINQEYEETIGFFTNVFNDGPSNPLYNDAVQQCATLKSLVKKLKHFLIE